MPPSMPTSTQIAAIQHSFLKLAPKGQSLSKDFYALLFETYPDVRPLFPEDVRPQEEKFLATLAYVVAGLSDVEAIKQDIRVIGARHRDYQATPELYDAVGGVLLKVLARLLGHRWSPELQSAWLAAYRFIAAEMLAGAGRDALAS